MKQATDITPGYVWGEVTPDMLKFGEVPAVEELQTIDIQRTYPLPDATTLQQTFDSRETTIVATEGGIEIPVTQYNRFAEDPSKVLFFNVGFGVDDRTPGGAISAATIAALNPDHLVLVANKADNVPDRVREQVRGGNFDEYTAAYWMAADELGVAPTVLAGPSRGGIITQFMAAQRPEGIDVVCAQETLTIPTRFTDIRFGARIMVRDNLRGGKQKAGSVTAEEDLYTQLENKTEFPQPGPMDLAGQTWLALGINRVRLARRIQQTITDNPGIHVMYTHGRQDAGMPIEGVRSGIQSMYTGLNPSDYARLVLMESETGHYGTGQTPRFGRLVRLAIDRFAAQ